MDNDTMDDVTGFDTEQPDSQMSEDYPDDVRPISRSAMFQILQSKNENLGRVVLFLTIKINQTGLFDLEVNRASKEIKIPVIKFDETMAELFQMDFVRAHRTENEWHKFQTQYQLSPDLIKIQNAYQEEARHLWETANVREYRRVEKRGKKSQ